MGIVIWTEGAFTTFRFK